MTGGTRPDDGRISAAIEHVRRLLWLIDRNWLQLILDADERKAIDAAREFVAARNE